jgi:hypothetical protein
MKRLKTTVDEHAAGRGHLTRSAENRSGISHDAEKTFRSAGAQERSSTEERFPGVPALLRF